MPLALAEVAPVAFDLFGRISNPLRSFRIAVLSEGFLPSDMARFRIAALQVVRELLATQPFQRQRDRLAIVRIDCTSRASAQLLQPRRDAPKGYLGNTPFDVHFDKIIERKLIGDRDAVNAVLRAVPGLPHCQAALVILNSDHVGGTADGDVAWLSLQKPGPTFVHELGHAGFALGDEYDYTTGEKGELPKVRTSSSEPAAPNLTRHERREDIPWRALLTPNVPLPSTVVAQPCTFDHPPRKGVPAGAVGLFEGGDQHACGVFRPSLHCKMRDEDSAFCLVCEQEIFSRLAGVLVDSRPAREFAADDWTHAVPLPPFPGDPDPFNIALYNTRSGRLAVVSGVNLATGAPNATRPNGETFVDPGFHSIAGFVSASRPFLAFDNLLDQRKVFRVDRVGLFSGQASAFIEVFEQPALVPPSIGFSHMLELSVAGQSALLRYDRITGGLELQTLLPIFPVPTTLASTPAGSLRPWHKNLSSLTSLNIAGVAHVVGIDATAGRVRIARVNALIDPQPMTLLTDTFESAQAFLQPFRTHALVFSHAESTLLLTYSTLDGLAQLYRVRPDQSGLDFVFSWGLTPGAKALFDVGQSAFGVVSLSAGDELGDHLWFYNAGLQKFSLTRLR